MSLVRRFSRIFRGAHRRDRLPGGTPKGRELIPLFLLLVAIAATAVVWSRFEDSIVDVAFGPLGLLPDVAQDDGAGDALTPAAEADLYLPSVSALENAPVVAAVGPIARLSCTKDDPATSAGPAADPSQAAQITTAELASLQSDAAGEAALDTPLEATGADADTVASEHLLAAAASPIAGVSVPADTPPAAPLVLADAGPAAGSPAAGSCPALLQRTFNRLQTGKPESLCQFDGKVLLVVNTASYCGYTHQYEGLEAMYRKYKDRGLVVVGFPSNDFGQQEPGSNKEIAEFCRLTYGVQFPMFEKSSVSDLKANPLFSDLAATTGKTPQWNFHKYVIDRTGAPVASFTSQVEPTDKTLVALIERLLSERPRKG